MYFNRLNGKNVYDVIEWIDGLNARGGYYPHYDYTLELDENGDGSLMVGNYYSDGMDYDIVNYVIVWTEERVWD